METLISIKEHHPKLSSKPKIWYEIHWTKVRLCISVFKNGSVTPNKLLGATFNAVDINAIFLVNYPFYSDAVSNKASDTPTRMCWDRRSRMTGGHCLSGWMSCCQCDSSCSPSYMCCCRIQNVPSILAGPPKEKSFRKQF